MQKYILKITIIISIITIISWILCVYPSFSTNEEVDNNIQNEVDLEDSDEVSNTETNNDVSSTKSNTTVQKSQTSSNRQINSYSTVSTLPEANLGLNNILNVILIAIGIIIILLAIAILIRLNK